MLVRDAQHEVRRVYLGGLVGNAVSGILWLASAGFANWYSEKAAIILLVVGGFLFAVVGYIEMHRASHEA
jgi:hypothetical protein